MGFGAERANLMGEAAIQMPEDSTAAGSSMGSSSEQSAGASTGDLSTRANNAKTNLI